MDQRPSKWSPKGAKWSHNGGPRGSKRIVVVVVVVAGRAQLASERSERASGAIDEAKCSPKGARRSHNGAPRGSKRICVVVVVAAGRAQLASERSERASGAIDVTGMRVTCVTCSPCNALPVHLPRQVLGVSFFTLFSMFFRSAFFITFWKLFGGMFGFIFCLFLLFFPSKQ